MDDYTGDILFTYNKDLDALRQLWDEAFDDPEEFSDYYFSDVCKNNKILSAYIDDRLVGMIHLNPYNMLVNGQEKKSYYVVGVAVTLDMREKGIMKAMMKKVSEDAKHEGVDFLFLMPALEDYYNNLGYKKIYSTKSMDFTITEPEDFERDVSDCYASLMLCTEHIDGLDEDTMESVAEIINEKLGLNYNVYCKRDKAYLLNMIEEHKCQCGNVCMVTEHMMSECEDEAEDMDLIGLFSYDLYDDTMYVERFESFVDNSMALMISVLKLANELSCSRCIITVSAGDVDGYEHILEGIELDITEEKGIMAQVLIADEEKYLDIMMDNTFIDEIV